MLYRPVHTCAAVAALMLTSGLASAQLIDQTTYQGRLEFNGAAATGRWGVAFRVWDSAAAGVSVSGGHVRALNLAPEDDGVFTVDDLNFGMGVFDGSDRWIELVVWEESVLFNGIADPGELVETLTRQPITAAPQAQFALSSGFANFSGTTLDEAHTNGNVIANNGGAALVVEGGLEIGTSSLSGTFGFNNSAAGINPNILMRSHTGIGASLLHFDENGSAISRIEPDFNGEGIWVRFAGDGGMMQWDGDLSSTETGSGSRLTISGPASTSLFNTSVAGNSSVALPIDAISPSETLAEAGVANNRLSFIELTTTTSAFLSRSITVPTAGYVLVLAQGSLSTAYFGARGTVTWGVSKSPTSLPFDQNITFDIPTGLPNGSYNTSASAHGLFSVAAGTSTFYFNARKDSTTNMLAWMRDSNLTLLFVPTSYGTVVSNLIDPANPDGGNNTDVALAPMSALDIEAEYQAELARRDAEIMALIAEQQRQLDEMRAEMRSSQREQELGRKVTLER